MATGALLCSNAVAQTDDDRLEAAQAAFNEEKFDTVFEQLGPLLKREPAGDAKATFAREVAAAAHQRRGEQHFRNARVKESVADFDKYLEYHPDRAPGHWQRGISHYYAGMYEEGVVQFEIHRTVNPEDVENAVWHFLCAVRAPGGNVKDAQANLIPIQRDGRVPMAEVHLMFSGEIKPEEVLEAGGRGGDSGKFYADLYVGLYHEALGDEAKGLLFIARAAENPASNNYMGDVARTHLLVREEEAKKREALKKLKQE